jgi:hypothetical protein
MLPRRRSLCFFLKAVPNEFQGRIFATMPSSSYAGSRDALDDRHARVAADQLLHTDKAWSQGRADMSSPHGRGS